MKKNALYFVLSLLTLCCSFDLNNNITDSTEVLFLRQNPYNQKDSLSTIISVPKDLRYSEKSYKG